MLFSLLARTNFGAFLSPPLPRDLLVFAVGGGGDTSDLPKPKGHCPKFESCSSVSFDLEQSSFAKIGACGVWETFFLLLLLLLLLLLFLFSLVFFDVDFVFDFLYT